MTIARDILYTLIKIWIAVAGLWFLLGYIGMLIRPANPSGAGPARRAEVAPHARRASLRLVDER